MTTNNTKQSRIPQYYAVFNDGSEAFKRFLEWHNEKHNINRIVYDGEYCGYDGISHYSGTGVWDDVKQFKNNPTVFDNPAEFMKLVDGENTPEIWDERKLDTTLNSPKTDEQILAMQYVDNIIVKLGRIKSNSKTFKRDMITLIIDELKTKL